jgi:hypothetical protein
MKRLLLIVIPVLGFHTAFSQNSLPARSPSLFGDFEPAQMLDGPHSSASPAPVESPDDRLKRCQAALAVAQKRAGEAQGLFQEGILARVEMEGRYMQVVKEQKEVAEATVAVAAARADAVKKSFDAHQSTQADLDSARAALQSAQAAATVAAAAWDKSQLDAATIDLQRKRKLYSEGVCSRKELQMAEDRLILLTGTLPK